MHCADQGVGPDFMGNLFDYLVRRKMPGNNELERAKALGTRVFKYYDDNLTEDRLKEFLPKTFKSEKKKRPPKLKGNAATARALIPFASQIAAELLDDADPKEAAMKDAAKHLHNCYEALRGSNKACSHEALYESSKNFALQYDALHLAAGRKASWRPMPKMHLFLELCSQRCDPEKFWLYRDEDFGGSVAKQSRMKGRWKKVGAFGKHALDMFRMKNSPPRIIKATC